MLLDDERRGKPIGAAEPSWLGSLFLKGYVAVINGSNPPSFGKLRKYFFSFAVGSGGNLQRVL
jgi:hypothetical protein